jgi:hypothetical protein
MDQVTQWPLRLGSSVKPAMHQRLDGPPSRREQARMDDPGSTRLLSPDSRAGGPRIDMAGRGRDAPQGPPPPWRPTCYGTPAGGQPMLRRLPLLMKSREGFAP